MGNERVKNQKKIIFLILLMLLVVAGGTYAWFTWSNIASTDTAKATTAEDNFSIYISSEGGDSFKKRSEADIIKINASDPEWLMPVSTADLKKFVYSPSSPTSEIERFTVDEEGKYYYRGRIYLKAEASKDVKGDSFDLYLDVSDGCPVVAGSSDSNILNASRLGLLIDGKDSVIMSLSSKHNGDSRFVTETIIDGKPLAAGEVIYTDGEMLKGVKDPAVSYMKYGINLNDEVPELPDKKIMSMELNRIYEVDVLFYLEGCDIDCTEDIGTQDVNLKLNFYGVLN